MTTIYAVEVTRQGGTCGFGRAFLKQSNHEIRTFDDLEEAERVAREYVEKMNGNPHRLASYGASVLPLYEGARP